MTEGVCQINIQRLLARLGDNREEVIREAARCRTAAELMELGGSIGFELEEEQAGKLLTFLRPRDEELSPSELDVVTGGDEEEEKKNPECKLCGSPNTFYHPQNRSYMCDDCGMCFW